MWKSAVSVKDKVEKIKKKLLQVKFQPKITILAVAFMVLCMANFDGTNADYGFGLGTPAKRYCGGRLNEIMEKLVNFFNAFSANC